MQSYNLVERTILGYQNYWVKKEHVWTLNWFLKILKTLFSNNAVICIIQSILIDKKGLIYDETI